MTIRMPSLANLIILIKARRRHLFAPTFGTPKTTTHS
jgi:hypothetical protein